VHGGDAERAQPLQHLSIGTFDVTNDNVFHTSASFPKFVNPRGTPLHELRKNKGH
jgi:hypothetical protein